MAKACLILAGLFAVAALLWMAFLPAFVLHELRTATGFDVRAASITANPFTGTATVRGLFVTNPPDYAHPDFIELRGLDADLEVVTSLLSDRVVFDRLDIDLAKVEIVRQVNGRLNVSQFSSGVSGGGAAGAQSPAPPGGVKYLVKKLHLRLDQLVVSDASGSNPYEKTYDVRIDQSFTDVSEPRQLLVPQVVRSLYSFGLRRDTAQLLPGDFGRALAVAVDQAAHVGSKAKEAVTKTGQILKGFLDKLEQSAKP